MKKSVMRASVFALLYLFLTIAHANSVQHITNSDGLLIGANNVEVNGRSYNVRFVEGLCSTIQLSQNARIPPVAIEIGCLFGLWCL